MPNKLYINNNVCISGTATNQHQHPAMNGFFVGHRFHNDKLEILIGKRTGNEYCIAALLDQGTAQEMVARVTNILKSSSGGKEPTYTNPTPVTIGPDGIKNGEQT